MGREWDGQGETLAVSWGYVDLWEGVQRRAAD